MEKFSADVTFVVTLSVSEDFTMNWRWNKKHWIWRNRYLHVVSVYLCVNITVDAMWKAVFILGYSAKTVAVFKGFYVGTLYVYKSVYKVK